MTYDSKINLLKHKQKKKIVWKDLHIIRVSDSEVSSDLCLKSTFHLKSTPSKIIR